MILREIPQCSVLKCLFTVRCVVNIISVERGDLMATTNISFRMEEGLKKQAEKIFDEMGMNMTTAFTVFTKAVVRSGKIPFEISVDPFWRTEHQAHLEKVIAEYESGKATLITKTMEELEAMENG